MSLWEGHRHGQCRKEAENALTPPGGEQFRAWNCECARVDGGGERAATAPWSPSGRGAACGRHRALPSAPGRGHSTVNSACQPRSLLERWEVGILRLRWITAPGAKGDVREITRLAVIPIYWAVLLKCCISSLALISYMALPWSSLLAWPTPAPCRGRLLAFGAAGGCGAPREAVPRHGLSSIVW